MQLKLDLLKQNRKMLLIEPIILSYYSKPFSL